MVRSNWIPTARISNVDSVMFVNRRRKMVSFELGEEIEKEIFSSCFFFSNSYIWQVLENKKKSDARYLRQQP